MKINTQNLSPFTFFLCLLFAASALFAETAPKAGSYAGKEEMGGIRFSEYKDFERKWHPVTVRFRKDTDEMRFVYANDQAWEVLKSGSANYPDGAVLAKVGVVTHDDPSFPSSAVPGGVRRFQLMVKDRAKYRETDGWGYALFDAQGVTFSEDPKSTAQACAACHRAVAEKGFVFSEIMEGTRFSTGDLPPGGAAKVTSGRSLDFSTVKIEKVPVLVRGQLPKGTRQVRMLQGQLRKSLFQGTLDEIQPTLAQEAVKAGLPAVLLSEDGLRFSLVFEDKSGICGSGEVALHGIHSVLNGGKAGDADASEGKYEKTFCRAKK